MISKTVCITQEGPANALALNKDNSQVVIAGRNGKLSHQQSLIIKNLFSLYYVASEFLTFYCSF